MDADPIGSLIVKCKPCAMEPKRFFVSWQGVLTLAYSGFPPPLVQLKRALGEAFGGQIPNENPGSKWPKTSLGCLKDGKRLTPDQLATLIKLCGYYSHGLPESLPLHTAATVLYTCRSLERVVSCHTVPFASADNLHEDPDSSVSEEERVRVDKVLAECREPDYWFAASRDGNREAHYRGTHIGATLVCKPPRSQELSALHQSFCAFRQHVDQELPGMYTWFSDESLHVTVRALSA